VFIVDKVLSHPLFAIILSLISAVLALVGGHLLIWISILGAWAITLPLDRTLRNS
jgi:hypothetical protein